MLRHRSYFALLRFMGLFSLSSMLGNWMTTKAFAPNWQKRLSLSHVYMFANPFEAPGKLRLTPFLRLLHSEIGNSLQK
jgi:hypothetical protein